MRLKKNVGRRLVLSPSMLSAAASAVCTGASQYLDVFAPLVPETGAWRGAFFAAGIFFAVLAAIAPGIFVTEDCK